MGAGNRTVESISSSGQVQRLLAGKVATTVRAFRVPDNYGHRSARLRLRSFWLQNHRSARLTKGSETVLSVLDLKTIKAHRGPLRDSAENLCDTLSYICKSSCCSI